MQAFILKESTFSDILVPFSDNNFLDTFVFKKTFPNLNYRFTSISVLKDDSMASIA